MANKLVFNVLTGQFDLVGSGSSSSGTVTSVSVVTSSGVSATVATATTTPALTFTLGVITPTSVNGLTLAAQAVGFTIAGGSTSKTLTVPLDATVSGTNTGDQTLAGLGGANTALSNLASVAINTDLILGSSDGGALGSTSKMWSDLFVASGAVLNFNNGDVTITHSADTLTVAGGNLVGLGATTATTFNGLAITANGTNTLAITAGKTLTVSNDATVSGTNTGDQTITLTGNVTGSGTGSFAATIATSVALAGSPTTTTQTPGDNSTKIATTAYVDAAVLGQDFKEAAKYATTAALPSIVYANGSSGVGATLTGVALGALSVDGNSPAVADRILVKNQVSTFQQGIYVVTATGSAGAVFVLTRATDGNQSFEWKTGDSLFVTTGTANASTTWAYNGVDSPTMGTDAITFAQTAGQGTVTSGNGITVTGLSVAIDTSVTVDKTTVQTLTNKTLTSPVLTTPTLGVASATSLATSASSPFLLTNGQLVTIALTSQTVGTATLTIPDFANVSDEFTFKTKSQTMSNKTFVAPVLGAATATSINGLAITSTTGTLTMTNAKTLSVSNTLTLAGTDSTTMTFPTTSATIARTDAANTFTGVQAMTSPDITTSLTTPSSTFALLNATATTINFAGASSAVVNFGGGVNAAELRFLEPSGSGSNYSALKAQAQGSNITYTLPATVASANQVLTDAAGNGTLSWTTPFGVSQTLVDGTNISWNMNSGNFADVTLAGNRTLDNATNIAKNQESSLTVYQDSVGGRTLAYGTQYTFNGAMPVLSTGPLLVDILYFTNDGSHQYNVTITKGFGSTNAYFAGGDTTSLSNGLVANVQALDFNTDTTTQVTKGALTQARDAMGAANSATTGYFAGGYTGATVEVTTGDGLTFATDTTAAVTKGALSTARGALSGANSSTVGYFVGGSTGGGVTAMTTAEGLTFSTDTTTQTTRGALTTKMAFLSAVNSSTIGYFSSGTTDLASTGVVTTDNGLTFATDTNAQVTKGVLSTARTQAAATNSSTIGYFSGGVNSGGTKLTTTLSLTFSTDTTTMVTKGALGTATSNLGAANSGAIGYYSGGVTGAAIVAVTNGLVYSTDTTTLVTKGAMSTGKEYSAGVQGSKLGLTQIV